MSESKKWAAAHNSGALPAFGRNMRTTPKGRLTDWVLDLFREPSPLPAPLQAGDSLAAHLAGLRELGLGQVEAERSAQGIRVRLRGYILPGGSRTDMLILLPMQFPVLPPEAFFLQRDAAIGHLDLGHLYARWACHGAPNLPAEAEGWLGYCLIADWDPRRHTLAGFVAQIGAQLTGGPREA